MVKRKQNQLYVCNQSRLCGPIVAFATLYLSVHYLIGVILVFNLQVLYTQRAITVATTTVTFFSQVIVSVLYVQDEKLLLSVRACYDIE